MQFVEPASKKGQCPVCGKPVVVRSTRGTIPYCSQTCASQQRYSKRYTGSQAGQHQRPDLVSKTKWQS